MTSLLSDPTTSPPSYTEGATLEKLFGGPKAESIFSRSASRWQALLLRAKSISNMPETSLDLKESLCRIPQLPIHIPSDSRWIEGHSTWSNADASCPMATKTERVMRIFLTKRHPTICTVSSSSNFHIWDKKANNGIMLLTLGWAYVLSAELAERKGLRMEYGLPVDTPSVPIVLDLDYASPAELRWWRAIVSPGVGWSMTEGVAPWAVSVMDIGIEIRGGARSGGRPPTAREAACYLSRLCDAYDLGNQSSAALAAALTIPLHASTASHKPIAIELPKPVFDAYIGCPSQHELPADFRLIGYSMTLSLSTWALGPSLWSVFWDSDVPCNFAGAWLAPIASILKSIIDNDDMELLAKLLSFSNVSPLWLGIALCGRKTIINSILPSLTKLYDLPFFRPNIDAAAWTGTAQSFLDCHQTQPCLDGMVSRADVWRLRHDCHEQYSNDAFKYTPPYGWPPFGEMRAVDVELEIQNHLPCSHDWKYSHWSWSLRGEVDAGFSMDGTDCHRPREKISMDTNPAHCVKMEESGVIHLVSETATKAVFWWSCDQVERGFGGTIVPRHFGPDEVLKDSEKIPHLETDFIYQWLDTVDT